MRSTSPTSSAASGARCCATCRFTSARGESFGLVGESGCGKSTMALAVVRYLARNGAVDSGRILIDGRDVLAMNGDRAAHPARRDDVDGLPGAGRALNPSIKVGRQMAEVYEIAGIARAPALTRSQEMLEKVRIADPESVMNRYPHQLSGGMLQRVVIAMALASEPSLLILDEPTTALDATVEAEVLDLVSALRSEFDTSLLFISHNLGVIAKMCDRVGVLYAGELVEEGPALEVFNEPRHPYTVGLLRCIPRRDTLKAHRVLDTIPGFLPSPGSTSGGCIFADRCGLVEDRCRREVPELYPTGANSRSRCFLHDRAQTLPRVTPAEEPAGEDQGTTTDAVPLIRVEHVSKTFRVANQDIHGLVDVSLDLAAGETLGLVGESGSGKTTLARVLLGLTAPDPGATITLGGDPLPHEARGRSRAQQKALQIVFQNPDSALNRRHSVRRLISRVLTKLGGYRGEALTARLATLIADVRLSPASPRNASRAAVRRPQAARRHRARVCRGPADRRLR